MLFASTQMKLNSIQDDKRPLRDHLMHVYKQTKILPELLRPVHVSPALAHLWNDFVEIKNGSAGDRISYQDIDAWQRLTGASLSSTEISLIKRLERIYEDGR